MMTMTDYRIDLQEQPEYKNGWEAANAGKPRHWLTHGLTYKAREAWLLGYDDCIIDRQTTEPNEVE